VRWVRVKRVQGMVEANIVKGLLEANGIPVKLRHETAAVLFGLSLDGLGEVEVMVPEDYRVYAERLINESGEEADGLDS